ncbi:hypothetical protein BS17DRAFT_477134 [Gyrodon lividus]|nr:hypothetical protein BS17DRAFT_477134 [Gyrodon lividus]
MCHDGDGWKPSRIITIPGKALATRFPRIASSGFPWTRDSIFIWKGHRSSIIYGVEKDVNTTEMRALGDMSDCRVVVSPTKVQASHVGTMVTSRSRGGSLCKVRCNIQLLMIGHIDLRCTPSSCSSSWPSCV